VASQVGAVKIYSVTVEPLKEKERQDKTQFTTKTEVPPPLNAKISYIGKDVSMRNEASSESVRLIIRPVIRPLSIRSVVHGNRHPESSEVAGCTPSLHPSAESDTAAFCPPKMGRK